ncbi:O-antigen ligase family protein [Peribacillus sp. NPDC056705]|uniref:O-antigen ligase family protein n=1 Tax=Peribacillus sp. NPDC056705 TaxID=3345918 RepID=UPI003748C10C
MEAQLSNYNIKKKDILEIICYGATFVLILLSFVYKNERLILYSFEFCYIILIGFISMKKNRKIGMYALWSAIFFTICLLSCTYAVNQEAAAMQTINVLKILLIGNSLVLFINNDEKKLNFVLISIIISALYTTVLLIIYTPINYWGSARLGESIGLNANDLALKMTISSLIIIYFGKKNKKTSYFILGAIFLLITFLTGSRKAFLMFLMGLIFLTFLTIKKRRRIFIVLPIMIFIIYLLWNITMTNPVLYSLLGIRIEGLINAFLGQGAVDESTLVRMKMIENGMQLFIEKPFLGYGIDNFVSVSSFSVYSHNNYIELLVGMGIFGTLVYYSLYLGIIYKLFRSLKNNSYAAIFISLIIGLAVMEYGLVTYYIEIYQILIACAYSASIINTNNTRTYLKK